MTIYLVDYVQVRALTYKELYHCDMTPSSSQGEGCPTTLHKKKNNTKLKTKCLRVLGFSSYIFLQVDDFPIARQHPTDDDSQIAIICSRE